MFHPAGEVFRPPAEVFHPAGEVFRPPAEVFRPAAETARVAQNARSELEPRSDTALYVGATVTGLALLTGGALLVFANAAASDARVAGDDLALGGAGRTLCFAPSSDSAARCNGHLTGARSR